ncbi:formylglycine-generating enzyme family protein [Candidatus Pacearchaeota archaeon]|nr:formylglycine-generating enzyme family protein [Candidatus Pacearchaeota archaeon]
MKDKIIFSLFFGTMLFFSLLNFVFAFDDSNMSVIPAGTFTMGSTTQCITNIFCSPVTSVSIDSFYMDKYEVTNKLWNDVVTWGQAHGYDFSYSFNGKASSFTAPINNLPVQHKAWHVLLVWSNARSEMEGLTPVYYTSSSKSSVLKKITSPTMAVTNSMVNWNANGYRLPTEAEWEYASRGGLEGKRFPWGDNPDLTKANYCSGGISCESSGIAPKVVGSYPANGYGLFDMAGNVAEWVWDCHDNYAGMSKINPKKDSGDGKCQRIRRGGASSWSVNYIQNSYRASLWPEWSGSYNNMGAKTGFRNVRKYTSPLPPANCTSSDWFSSPSSLTCPREAYIILTWTKNTNCTGGVQHNTTERQNCVYQPTEAEKDDDNDKVINANDKCPETAAGLKVNFRGCPLPKIGNYKTSSLGSSDLNSVRSFEIKSNDGNIKFNASVALVRWGDQLDLETHVIIEKHKIAIDSNNLPELNVPATLVFNNVNLTNPVVLRDGVLCSDCFLMYASGTAVVEVPGFSTYELVEKSYYDTVINKTNPPITNCIPSWTCSNWTECADNSQIRECFDQNNCNLSSGKPNEVQTCSIPQEIVCIPDWECSAWAPEVCDEIGLRTRECLDKNNCNAESTKPEEKEECVMVSQGFDWSIVWIIVIILILIAGILFYYFKYFRNKKQQEKIKSPPFTATSNPAPIRKF